MSRERLVAIAKRNIEHQLAGTVPLADAVTRLPAANYFDPDRWKRELDLIFKRLPLALALTAELREPNSYKAIDVAGVPVLLWRDLEGGVGAFVNMCSHRGSMLVDEGHGSGRRITCPYHTWTYDQRGDLVGVFRERDVGPIDRSCLGLTKLPVAERAGLIWCVLSPGATIDIDAFLGEYGELLGYLRLAEMHHYGTRVVGGPNWKIAFDGYVDFYHLPILHKNTFGEAISPDAVFHPLGPHQRITGPRQEWATIADLPEDQWSDADLTSGVWSTFPDGSIAGFEVGGVKVYQVARIFPGPTPEESVSHLDFVSLGEPTDDFRRLVDKQIEFLVNVVRDEDYATGLKIQRTVRTGAKRELVFGRNEGGAQHVHRWIDRVLETPDDGLDALFGSTGT